MENSGLKIKAVIYDMDGLLVDSEPWWRVAERNVFGRLSIEPSEEDFERMMGNRIQEVIANWYARHPWEDYNAEKTQQDIVDEVQRLVTANANLLPGVRESLEYFQSKNLPIALASSSPLRLIHAIVDHYDIRKHFNVIRSAENEKRGKPHPDVFLSTAKELNIHPMHCLVFEDSFNGMMAAKNAGMKCVVVPMKEHYGQERFNAADLQWSSLVQISELAL